MGDGFAEAIARRVIKALLITVIVLLSVGTACGFLIAKLTHA